MMPTYTPNYSNVGLVLFQSAILVFRSIIGDSRWLNGKSLKKDFKNVLLFFEGNKWFI
jgi:hypothetical protein